MFQILLKALKTVNLKVTTLAEVTSDGSGFQGRSPPLPSLADYDEVAEFRKTRLA
jgi:hypothetical protein